MAIIDPWDIEDIRSIPQGQMPRGTPTLEELFERGRVQVAPGEVGPDPRAAAAVQQLSDYAMRDRSGVTYGGAETAPGYAPGSTFFPEQRLSFWDQIAEARNLRGDYPGAEEAMKMGEPIRKELEAGKTREAEQQQLQIRGVEQRKGTQLQEELRMQGEREKQAQEHASALEKIRKTPLSGLLGMTLEQFDALPPAQQEQYRKAVMMQSGGFGKVMESMMMISQSASPEERENITHYALALAESLFTKQSVEDLISRTVDAKGRIKIRHKRFDISGASPGIRPQGQTYGPEEAPASPFDYIMRFGRRFGTSTEAPPPGMGEPGVEIFEPSSTRG